MTNNKSGNFLYSLLYYVTGKKRTIINNCNQYAYIIQSIDENDMEYITKHATD